MEAVIKTQLIESVKNIKNKLKKMKQEEADLELRNKKILKPLIDPFETMMFLHNSPKQITSFNENECNNKDMLPTNANVPEIKTPVKMGNNVAKVNSPRGDDSYLQVPNKPFNVAFGVRHDGETLMIGNSPVTLRSYGENSTNKISTINVNDKNYELTAGLKELLFQSKPNCNIINEKDKITYKDILVHTNVHKRGFSPQGQIQGNSGMKYCEIIKPLFQECNAAKQGGNLPSLKKYYSNTDFVYWDDPNELIERLKILIASKDAGNTNHDNEIISIIEELKEAGIIKE